MKKYDFDNVVILHDKDRIPLSSIERKKRQGPYRYYGAQGVIDHIDDYLFDGEYILIAEDGENLKSRKQNIAQLVCGKFWVNNHAHIVTTTDICKLRYFYYLINTINLSEYITGSAQPKLSQSSMRKMSFVLPEIDIQDKILKIVGEIDDKIEVNEEINKNLEQQAEALFYSLFIEKINPIWKDGVLSDLGTIVGGGTPSKTKPEYYSEHGIAWITPKDLSLNKSKFISHGEIDISELGFSKSSATKMPPGTVLFSSRAPIGYIAIAANEVTTNQGFKSVVPNENIGTAYVYYLLKFLLPTIKGMASGSTFKEISGTGIKSVPVVIPDDEAIEKFNTFCTPIFQQQEILEAENSRLTNIRDTLLPKLMSGELDVSDIDL
ncbi:restriction endonuclease subunit S [uncultured Mitsuokella sp.]|uniref:restriction endonuclease subunit S n=1 Tax=uncultured Mitsuokella sp. TaxID=453120 RepID=UPI00260871A7|nr:restriction endonuclease subunit S [uncultured Mitsuokella sp.]